MIHEVVADLEPGISTAQRPPLGRGLRFAFLTTFYPPFNFGGDGIGIERLAHGLVRAGHHVTVVHDLDAYEALTTRRPTSPGRAMPGLEVIGLRSGWGTLSPLLTQQTGRPIANGARLRQLLDAGNFDVINYHNISLIGGPALLSYGSAVKIYFAHEHWLVCPTHVLWRHGREVCDARECLRCQLHYRRPPQWWRWTGLLERNLDHVDTFVAMSEFSRTKHREFGFSRDMEVLPYFLPDAPSALVEPQDAAEAPPHHRPYFLFVGRLEEIKGVQDLLPAFDGDGDSDLVIVGDGEFGDTLRKMAAHLPRVRFIGRVESVALGRWYRHALALLVPSRCFETFGIIVLEAFQQGTPVIARRLGPLPEIIATARGGLVFETAAELVAAMQQIERNPTVRNELAEHGAAALQQHWSEGVVVPQYLELVHRATARHARTARATQSSTDIAS